MTLRRLTGPQRLRIRDALKAAFHTQSAMEELLQSIDKSFKQLSVAGTNFTESVLEVVMTAEAKGWLLDLLAAAESSAPKDPEFRTILDDLAALSPPVGKCNLEVGRQESTMDASNILEVCAEGVPGTDSTGPSESGPHDSNELGAMSQGKPKYFVGDGEDSFSATLNPHERNLRDLGIALKDIKPVIFREPGLKGELLRTAQRMLLSVNSLIDAVGEVAKKEYQNPRRGELQDLAKNLRDHREEILQKLSELSATRSERSARRLCGDLTEAAAARRHVQGLGSFSDNALRRQLEIYET